MSSSNVWNLYILASPLSTTTGAGFRPGFTQNPICHIYYLATTHIALPTPSSMIMPLSLPRLSLSLWLSVCLIAPSRSGTHACSCRARQRPASQEIESRSGPWSCSTAGVLQSATRFCSTDPSVSQLCLERGRRSSANIYAPTHTLTPNQYVFKYSHTPPHTVAR